jgi:hypothetical protein
MSCHGREITGDIAMRRFYALTLTGLLLSSPTAWGWHCINLTTCKPVPCQQCGGCPAPCTHRLCPTLFGSGHVSALIEELHGSNAAHRVCAAEKLGCRLHADYCRCPEVLSALIEAMQCDCCWEVRKAAAWSIFHQGATDHDALLALYIASKMDPHFTVRFRAAQAIDILTVPYAPACFKDLWKEGDELVKALRAAGYRPGTENCCIVFNQVCGSAGLLIAPPPAPAAEPIPPPRPIPSGTPTPAPPAKTTQVPAAPPARTPQAASSPYAPAPGEIILIPNRGSFPTPPVVAPSSGPPSRY